jgi:hypothetical protein
MSYMRNSMGKEDAMAATVTSLEGTVENGQIKLPANVHLSERTKVYIVIPGLESTPPIRIPSPRLVHPEQASDFAMLVEDSADAGV